jgi:hypothetical protein
MPDVALEINALQQFRLLFDEISEFRPQLCVLFALALAGPF